MVRLVCMIDQRWLTRLMRLGRKPTCARIVRSLPSRPSPPRREPVLFCLALSIVRRPHRKHQTFPRWRHDNSVTGFKAGRAGYHALPALHQDVILQLIHGMERRIHPVSHMHGAQRTQAQPRNAEAREVRSRKAPPSDLLKHGQCRAAHRRRRAVRCGGLGWGPETSDGGPNLPPTSPRRHLPCRRGPQGCGPAKQSCIRSRGLSDFFFFLISSSPPTGPRLRHFHVRSCLCPRAGFRPGFA